MPGWSVERDWVQDSRSPGIRKRLPLAGVPRYQRHRFMALAPDGCPYVAGRSIQWRIHMSDIARPCSCGLASIGLARRQVRQPARKGLTGYRAMCVLSQHERDLAAGG